ncbi:MAG: hypothetical protein GY862_34630 [Gammaproteobacteria bacterium]|nr:hypothetical protein [Gammaproteobacteria bacterium]
MSLKGIWNDLVGTTTGIFRIGLNGPSLKNNSGAIQIRNAGDTADADLQAAKIQASADEIDLNANAAGSDSDWKVTLKRAVTGMTGHLTLTLPALPGAAGDVLTGDGAGGLSFKSAADAGNHIKTISKPLAFGDGAAVALFTLPKDTMIHMAEIIVDAPFDGGAPTVTIGVSSDATKYVPAANSGLKESAGSIFRTHPAELPAADDEALEAAYSPNGSTAGAARIFIHYSIPA